MSTRDPLDAFTGVKLTSYQKRQLEAEAKRLCTSAGAIIRKALVDAGYPERAAAPVGMPAPRGVFPQ